MRGMSAWASSTCFAEQQGNIFCSVSNAGRLHRDKAWIRFFATADSDRLILAGWVLACTTGTGGGACMGMQVWR